MRALTAALLVSLLAGGGACHGRHDGAAAGELDAVRAELLQIEPRGRALAAAAARLEQELASIPAPPADGCVDANPPAWDRADFRFDVDRERIVELHGAPASCSGEACRYVGHVAYLMANAPGHPATFLVYASIGGRALDAGGNGLRRLEGRTIDLVSGTLTYSGAPDGADRVYTFDRAPVVVINGYVAEKTTSSPSGASSRPQ